MAWCTLLIFRQCVRMCVRCSGAAFFVYILVKFVETLAWAVRVRTPRSALSPAAMPAGAAELWRFTSWLMDGTWYLQDEDRGLCVSVQ